MSLPWFPFNIKDFLANTLRLNTEAKGAYLCLMLDYYQTEQPPPDDDDVLASITGLSLDAWERHRKVLAPLFDIRDGHWHHDRIEQEIQQAKAKLASSQLRAKHANAAMHAKLGHKPASSQPQASTKQKASPKLAPSQHDASSEQTLEQTHLTLNNSLSNERENARAPEGSPRELEGRTFLDPNWVPDEEGLAFARSHGMTSAETIEAELLAFHNRAQHQGTMSMDWPAYWRTWCQRYAERPKPPPPRVDVSASAVDGKPTHRTYELALQRWITDHSGWSHQLGPAPGDRGCRVPRELLDQYNIDPETGLIRVPKKASS